MLHVVKVLAVALVVVFIAQLLWRRWRTAQKQAQRQLAMLEFADPNSTNHRDSLQSEFLKAATGTGKPRGLEWKQCDLHEGQLFAIDRVNGELFALVGTTIGFAAIPGGGMEDVEAVSNLRCATAIFVHRLGRWTTDGRVVFNLEPPQGAGALSREPAKNRVSSSYC